MSAQILNIIAKKALKDAAKKNINSKDPYFEEVPVYGRDGRPTGKVKKQKKGLPQGLSEHDGTVLKKVRRRAYRLDMSLFNLFGIRFGWSSVVGIIPVIGDFIDMFFAWNVVRTCGQIDGGLPPAIKSRMLFNVILDFGLGLVPFLGDLADAVFRANTRNAWILEEYLIKKSEAERKVQASHAAGHAGVANIDSNGTSPRRPDPVQTLSNGIQRLFNGSRSSPSDVEMGMNPASSGVTGNAGSNGNGRHQQHGAMESGVTRA